MLPGFLRIPSLRFIICHDLSICLLGFPIKKDEGFRQFRDLLKAGGAVGRKLDFLIQELNREVNTIGSKCVDLEITKVVVEMKSTIERIREQAQNIE